MPRKVVPLVTGETYHVYNRGTDKRDVFLDKQDYLRFYQSMFLFNQKKPVTNFLMARLHEEEMVTANSLVSFQAYSLLPNHFHFLVTQNIDGGLSEYIKRLSGGYTSYFNEKYERTGVLFQGKFKRVHVETNEQCQYLMAYVNENHVVHGLHRPAEIMYSSSLHYNGHYPSKLISNITQYSVTKGQQLAMDIHTRRLLDKSMTYEEDT